jgi:hypothetical protein
MGSRMLWRRSSNRTTKFCARDHACRRLRDTALNVHLRRAFWLPVCVLRTRCAFGGTSFVHGMRGFSAPSSSLLAFCRHSCQKLPVLTPARARARSSLMLLSAPTFQAALIVPCCARTLLSSRLRLRDGSASASRLPGWFSCDCRMTC